MFKTAFSLGQMILNCHLDLRDKVQGQQLTYFAVFNVSVDTCNGPNSLKNRLLLKKLENFEQRSFKICDQP